MRLVLIHTYYIQYKVIIWDKVNSTRWMIIWFKIKILFFFLNWSTDEDENKIHEHWKDVLFQFIISTTRHGI